MTTADDAVQSTTETTSAPAAAPINTALTDDQKASAKQSISAKFDNKVDPIEVSFSFRKNKELDTKRPTVELVLPLVSLEGVVSILESGDEKQQQLLLQAVRDYQLTQARSLVDDDESITQDNFPLDQVTWEFIANMPKSDRRGAGIAKEVWEEFGKDYFTVIKAATGKADKAVQNAVGLLLAKFAPVKTDKKVVAFLKDQLSVYINNTQNGEQFQDCYEFLVNKADKLLNEEAKNMLDAL